MSNRYPKDAIAVIGMACKFPGADSVEEFWHLLRTGGSMVAEMPRERFSTSGLCRSPDDKLRFWGSFLHDIDAFDHRFFKKSAREAASMDPQQRLLLQVAYQAMESTGYFGEWRKPMADDVGCFLGVCATDYNDNVASHPPNAYSSLGTLRAFLSGRLSHHFGWTGPSITFDTACSSSTVAIHAACKAIASGECSSAIAGGVSLYTSPNFYQNLAAANFLSPTGPSKPFDEQADGYCRGEGVGIVVLKSLSASIRDRDLVLGVICSSAVNQSSNTTPITVPNVGSQMRLYQKVSSLAGLDPIEISYVEAHGTGTQAGDPVEMESIRRVFGGARRTEELHVASVKGNIGHLEGASGVAALIKVILMMLHTSIPMQANFTKLNPKIRALETDSIRIPRKTQDWDTDFRQVCINNYGAAGSNAAMVVAQAPTRPITSDHLGWRTSRIKYPILVSAHSLESLKSYCHVFHRSLQKTLEASHPSSSKENLIADIAYNLAKESSRSLPYHFMTSVSSCSELHDQLASFVCGDLTPQMQIPSKAQPIVLVFGGQVSNVIGLSKDAYDASSLLRFHLGRCDVVLRSSGLSGLFPAIFSTNPIQSIVDLHCMLFSLQYACAHAWIDSGVDIGGLLGHSFGQLTALCVSECLSLEDSLKLVSGRAALIQKCWGPEFGSMISLETDVKTVSDILSLLKETGYNGELEYACYNGPTSQVLVGSDQSVRALQTLLENPEGSLHSITFKKLNTTHGFHSQFVEPLLPHLKELARELIFRPAKIPLETCSNGQSWTQAEPDLIVEHTRTPVYFQQAVQRLSSRLGPCTWLEAGSGSSVTNMVRRALDPSTLPAHNFQSMRLTEPEALSSLADATINLWKAGHKVHFWLFHNRRKSFFSPMILPPYQFEKSRHWLEWKDPLSDFREEILTRSEPKRSIVSFRKYQDGKKRVAEFHVDTQSKQYQLYVQGHTVLEEALCPVSVYVEMAFQAAIIVQEGSTPSLPVPYAENLNIKAPLGICGGTSVSLVLERTDDILQAWAFTVSSATANSSASGVYKYQEHATGRIRLGNGDTESPTDFAAYQRLMDYHKCTILSTDPEAEVIQGALIYKIFSKVVRYQGRYKGLRNVMAKGNEVVGYVSLPPVDEEALKPNISDPLAVDNFIQVAGIHMNSLKDHEDHDVFVCTKVDRILQSPMLVKEHLKADREWMVYSKSFANGETIVVNDIYVFDIQSKALVCLILGACFTKVRTTSLKRVLSLANTTHQDTSGSSPSYDRKGSRLETATNSYGKALEAERSLEAQELSEKPGLQLEGLRVLLSKVIEVPTREIRSNSTLEELGVDSLMINEVASAISKEYETNISITELQDLPTVGCVCNYLTDKPANVHGNDVIGTSSTTSVAMTTPASPISAIFTTTSAEPDASPHSSVVSRLADLLAQHLEVSTTMTRGTNLSAQGLDSLLSIELAQEIKKQFEVEIDMSQLPLDFTFGDLSDMVFKQQPVVKMSLPSKKVNSVSPSSNYGQISRPMVSISDLYPTRASNAQQIFENMRYGFDDFAKLTGFTAFWTRVYPMQRQLVLSYVVEAFAALGCSLTSLKPGESIPPPQCLPKYSLLIARLKDILKQSGLVLSDGTEIVRSDVLINDVYPDELLKELCYTFPQYAIEHHLLHTTGSQLAKCLSGNAEPLQILFRTIENRELLENVYTNGPMYQAITRFLGDFFSKVYERAKNGEVIHFLEVGGGTGGTTRHIVDVLADKGIPFTYTFTDLSGTLVAAAKKRFARYDFMRFAILDIEKPPPKEMIKKYHTVISTNCIHATRDLSKSLIHVREMLRPDGFASLVEFTRNLEWFDLVFGLLDGWWLFDDGRKHALVDEWFWDSSMRSAGFKHVSWTDGPSEESRTLRIINAFVADVENAAFKPSMSTREKKIKVETLLYKQAGDTCLCADIYYPTNIPEGKMPVALMIHGGGHIMLSRKEVRERQTQLLLNHGFLPVSIDYRLCPETTLLQGPMTDVCDALEWVRQRLPTLTLDCPRLQIDGRKVVTVGWSTGGHLAMTLAWTASQRGLRPPDAILAFYCPTDYEADFWKQPNYPERSELASRSDYDLLEAVQDSPITHYNVPPHQKAVGGWMSSSDARSRLVLHMSWKAQTVPILLNGLPSKHQLGHAGVCALDQLEEPPRDDVIQISPRAQVSRGNYHTPTYLIHGSADDLVPWQQSQGTYEALIQWGIPAGISLVEGAVHLFDLYRDPEGKSWAAVERGYKFLFQQAMLA